MIGWFVASLLGLDRSILKLRDRVVCDFLTKP